MQSEKGYNSILDSKCYTILAHSYLDGQYNLQFGLFFLLECVINSIVSITPQSSKVTDTSSAQARKGKDIQGIPWERLSISREKYRQTRLEQYKNYENIPDSGEASEKAR